jgi:hypothetical protein
MWPAPDPATREPDLDGVPPAAGAWAEPADGTIVDLRPGRPGPGAAPPPGTQEHEPSAGADWALSLGGTGTEGPLPAPAASPAVEGQPASAELIDRWRMARATPASNDNEFLSRPGLLASPGDPPAPTAPSGDGPSPAGALDEPSSHRWLRRPGAGR